MCSAGHHTRIISQVGRKAQYVLTLDSAIDIMTFVNFILPLFALTTNLGLGFPRIIRVYRAFLQLDSAAGVGATTDSGSTRQVTRILLGSMAFVLVFASTIFLLENAGNPSFVDSVDVRSATSLLLHLPLMHPQICRTPAQTNSLCTTQFTSP